MARLRLCISWLARIEFIKQEGCKKLLGTHTATFAYAIAVGSVKRREELRSWARKELLQLVSSGGSPIYFYSPICLQFWSLASSSLLPAGLLPLGIVPAHSLLSRLFTWGGVHFALWVGFPMMRNGWQLARSEQLVWPSATRPTQGGGCGAVSRTASLTSAQKPFRGTLFQSSGLRLTAPHRGDYKHKKVVLQTDCE